MRHATRVVTAFLLAALGAHAAASPPRALVLEHADGHTGLVGAADALRDAGFDVEPLRLDRMLHDFDANLIVIGSFASEMPRYAEWMNANRDRVRWFIRKGNVFLQMTQDPAVEPAPTFLMDGVVTSRSTRDADPVLVFDEAHPLVDELPATDVPDGPDELVLPPHAGQAGAWGSLDGHERMRVLLSLDAFANEPVLNEAQLGRGRLLVTSLYLDKLQTPAGDPVANPFFALAAERFFSALREYTEAVRDGTAPPVEPTPPYVPPFEPGSVTIVVLPDTQIYSQSYPDIFEAQTEWVVDKADERSIVAVLHEGDITNHNNHTQWTNAHNALDLLHGVVPYVLAPGNHDYGDNGSANVRTTLMSTYFPYARLDDLDTFGGSYEPDRTESTYHLFERDGLRFVAIALEWSPRDDVLAWADGVLKQQDDRIGLIVTHAYMYFDDTRYDRVTRPDQRWSPYDYGTANDPGGVNDGQEIWDNLVKDNPNVAMVFSGHVLDDGAGRISTPGDHGGTVHQMLANYQMRSRGGEGYLRLIEILPDGETIRVKTYSPYLDQYLTDGQHQFTLELDVVLR